MDKKQCIDKNYLVEKTKEVLHRQRLQQEKEMAEFEVRLEKSFRDELAKVEQMLIREAELGATSASYKIDEESFEVVDACLARGFKWPEKPANVIARIVKELLSRDLILVAETHEDADCGYLVIRW